MSHLFADAVAEHGARVATRIRVGDRWKTQTYNDFDVAIRSTARGLLAAGLQRGDRVAIFAHNCPEWTEADLACLLVGAIPVPIYATSTPEQVAHIVNDSQSRLIFVGGQSEAQRVAQAGAASLEKVVSFTPDAGVGTVSLRDVKRPADAELDAELQRRFEAASEEDLASIIYTSGTTGDPKGVMLPNRALVSQVHALNQFFDITPDDHSLCFLPLSHALERAWTTVVWSHGCMNTYVPNAKKVAEMMVLAQPTMMVSVPRLYETVFSTARAKVAGSVAKQKIFDWACRVGGQLQRQYRKGKTPNAYWRAQLPVADKLVLSNVRAAMGGPKKVLACGGAPLRQEIEEFFSAAGLLVLQGYGLTEAGPLVTFPAPDAFKFGTCGRVMPGGELRIGADAEILYRGPNVMSGYWNNPEATEASFEQATDGGDPWLRTGDAGYVDKDGYLVITDRIKDIIVTSNGKNISPQPIEGLILADPLFEHAVLLGDNRPCLALLVRPSLPHLTDLAKSLNISFTSPSELLTNQQVIDEMRRRAQAMTAKLPSHEQFRELRVLLEDFTMEDGLLTPTLKVKRREVERRFQEMIDEMYTLIAERRGGKRDND